MKTQSSAMKKQSRGVEASGLFVLGADETNRACGLIEKFDRMLSHKASLRRGGLLARVDAAESAYRSNPTDENFDEYKSAVIENEMFAIQPRVSSSIEFVLEKLTAEGSALLQQVMEPELREARNTLELVTEEENTEHLERFGYPLKNSKAVDSVAANVHRLEGMWKIIDPQSGSPNPRALRNLLSDLLAKEASLK